MMKLRYLFNNPDLAEMLLKNWDYDQDSVGLFQNFRISANAVYSFLRDGGLYYLRFCPITEKRRENILAELAFINFLRGRKYPALEPLPSKSGEDLVQETTPWGEYYACVFKGVEGVSLEETNFKGRDRIYIRRVPGSASPAFQSISTTDNHTPDSSYHARLDGNGFD